MKYIPVILIFILLPQAVVAQWLSAYSFRKEITIDETVVDGSSDLIDFPLLISITENDLKSVYNGGLVFSEDGWDIMFTLSDGVTLLDHEIELYTPTTGELVAWVRIPSLSYSSDTDIFIYFGNDNVSTDPSSSDTWSTDYKGVWHFSDGANDASQFTNHGVATGTSADVGIIGDSRYFDGTNDFIDIPNTASLNFTQYVTMEAWVKPAMGDPGHSWAILIKQSDYGMNYLTNDLRFYAGEYSLQTTYILNMGEWYYLVESYDGTTMRTYVNGIELDSYSNSTAISNDASNDVGIGRFIGNSTTRFTGNMDEVKLISEPRSAGWIKTSYDNQNNPGAFLSVSASEISNDNPCDATTILAGSSCSPKVFSNNYARDSGLPLTECIGYTGGDTWFKLTVPASGSLIVKLETNPTPEIPDSFDWLRRPGLAVYTGICSSLTHDTCWIDPHPGAPFDAPELTLTNYIPGETIFLRVWEYNNSKGKFSICAIEDNIDPVISCPSDALINCEGDNTPTGTGIATATDNYTPVNDITINYTDLSTYDSNPAELLHYNYIITRTWTATDAFGNTDNCNQVITVQDISDPVLSCLADITINCEDDTTPTGTGTPTAIDNCASAANITIGFSDVSTYETNPLVALHYNYVITRTWTATDVAVNSDNCIQLITVQDVSEPVISCPGDLTESVDTNCEFIIPDYLSTISISDNCDSNPTISQLPVQGTNISGSGTVQEIVIRASDICGNESECRFNIVLNDNTPPDVIVLRDTIITIEEDNYFVDLVIPPPIFFDNCGLSTVVNDFNGGNNSSGNYSFGTTSVIYTVTDINGNTSDFTQNIEVRISDMPENGLIIPEGFSPNNDGLNDTFTILGLSSYPQSKLRIFNGNGNEVYFSADYNNEWDGISNKGSTRGKELAGGNYYYIIYLPDDKGIIKGFIYLQRE